jgi:SNF2 family DNA or RNA helicase
MPELRPKQQEVIDDEHQRFIHADPPGTGKTPVGLTWLSTWEAERALIVAPRNVLRHWETLAASWAPEYEVHVLPVGLDAPHRSDVRNAWHLGTKTGDPAALIMPYTTMSLDIDALIGMGFDAIVFDEAHKLKGRTNLVFKSAAKLARRALIVDLTTASPILNRADECWSAMHMIDAKRWPSFWRWAREHFFCSITTFGGRAVRAIEVVGEPRPGALEQIARDFGELLVMRSEDELGMDLPDVVETFLMVDLTPAERKPYDKMSKHFWLEYGDTVVFAPNEVSKITRLRQISSDWGAMLDREITDDGTKVKATCELIEDELQGKSVVVFAQFKGTVHRIVRRLEAAGVSAVAYTGDLNDDERQAVLEEFADRNVQVLVGTDSTMAEGMDGLQHTAHHMVIVDPDWVPEQVNQKIGRLKRDGQLSPTVFVWYVLACNTIDQYVEQSRGEKKAVIDVIVGHTIADVLQGAQ